MNKEIKSFVRQIVFGLLILLLWYLLWYVLSVRSSIANDILVAPHDVARSLWKFIILNENNFRLQVLQTIIRLAVGFGISVLVGLLLAGVMLMCKVFRNEIRALLSGLQSIPNMCWVPFAIVICGLDSNAVYFVMILGCAPSVALCVESSFRNISPEYKRVGKTLGCNKIGMINRIYIPAALPGMIIGLRQSWAFAWRALMAGEMNCLFSINASGLGYLMFNLRYSGAMDKVMCLMLVILLMGALFDKLIFGTAEDKILRAHGIKRAS